MQIAEIFGMKKGRVGLRSRIQDHVNDNSKNRQTKDSDGK